MSNEFNEENQEVQTGASGLSIAGFVTAFLVSPVGLILSIIALAKKDGRTKGFAIAGLVISIINILLSVLICVALVGVMVPQVVKYIQKSNYAQDIQFADCIVTALETAAYDPYVLNNDILPYTDDFENINTIHYGAYRDEVETILEVPLEDLPYQFKSHDVNDIVIEYILTDKKCEIKVSDIDPNDGDTFSIVIN